MGLAGTGNGRRDTGRACPCLRPDRTLPSVQRRATAAGDVLRSVGDGPGSRRPCGADLRQARGQSSRHIPSGAGSVSDWISYEARLTEGYRRCARLAWRYGSTYFWGAALLPKPQRKHVHAICALCRLADGIVDLPHDQHPSRLESQKMRPEPVEGRERGTSTSSAATSDGGIPIGPNLIIPDPQSRQPVEGRGSGASTGSAHMLVGD